MAEKIALIYTTFLRPALARETIASIVKYRPPDSMLFIGDQSRDAQILHRDWIRSYALPFDCGLSAARNLLVKKASEQGFEYCLVTADSIKFTDQTVALQSVIEFLSSRPDYGIVGFGLLNRTPWEFLLDIRDGRFLLSPASQTAEFKGISYGQCDICRNFFLAKTKALLEVGWDNELKLAEHEDFFYRFKQAGWKTFFTKQVQAEYIISKPIEYLAFRNRMYQEFRNKLMQKHRLTGWIDFKY